MNPRQRPDKRDVGVGGLDESRVGPPVAERGIGKTGNGCAWLSRSGGLRKSETWKKKVETLDLTGALARA